MINRGTADQGSVRNPEHYRKGMLFPGQPYQKISGDIVK